MTQTDTLPLMDPVSPTPSTLPVNAGSRGWKVFYAGLMIFAAFSGFSISGMQIGLGIAFLGWCFCRWGEEVECKPVPFAWPYMALFAVSVLSLTNAVDLWRGFTELKKYLIIIVFLMPFSARFSETQWKRLLALLVFSGALAGGIGLAGSIKNMLAQAQDFRARGFYSMSITFGECQAMFLLLTLSWIKANLTYAKSNRWLWPAAILQFIGLLSSYSRGAFIGFGVGLVLLIGPNWKRLVAIFAVLGLVIIAAAGIFRPNLDVYQVESQKPQSIGGNLRWSIWKNGLSFWQQFPLLGVGLNNIKPHYKAFLKDHPDWPDKEAYGHLHNNFLQFLVMTGILGLLTFVWLVLAIGKYAYYAWG
ncbi:MAG TPA: O-antigen ligase family protein, partial [Candidatus Ozemobacteraceae bacterium]|nr:O-antigen ligase family protein [Candidatus Ozemobacteraceae bacterium]